jgi:hypothetical protein
MGIWHLHIAVRRLDCLFTTRRAKSSIPHCAIATSDTASTWFVCGWIEQRNREIAHTEPADQPEPDELRGRAARREDVVWLRRQLIRLPHGKMHRRIGALLDGKRPVENAQVGVAKAPAVTPGST